MSKDIIIIGGGLSGLSAACCLGKKGCKVTLLEKNAQLGGRARQLSAGGFKFDMGPSWYWMPDVFESFYNEFGFSASDFYELKRLDPSYRVFFGKNDFLDMPASMDGLLDTFELLEKGSRKNLKKFLKEAEYKYNVGMKKFVYRPGISIWEYADFGLLIDAFRLHMFKSISTYLRTYFSNPRLIHILEFPVLFLGAKPQRTPALYSMMNYADMCLGTWYPMGGMVKIIEGMEKIARKFNVEISTGTEVEKINVSDAIASVIANGQEIRADCIIGSADYHHVEQKLLDEDHRSYSTGYWNSRELAPSCLIFYLGVDKKLNNLLHHNLFFDEDFDKHQQEIYDTRRWPSNPLFYVCCPSKTDPDIAPEGKENLFILIPVAVGLDDPEEIREKYFKMVIERIEHLTGEKITGHISYYKSYAHSDFIADYHAYKGNGFGLANILSQTAVLKPSIRSKKVKNLLFTGQLTVPGPGMPPCIISGQVVSQLVWKMLNGN